MTQLEELAAGLAPLVDELGEIEAEIAPHKAKMKRAEALRAALRGAYRDAPANGNYTVPGQKWTAVLGACGNESIVDLPRLLDLVGPQTFVDLASVPLKALDRIAPAVRGAVVSTQMSGSRPLALLPAAPAAAPKKAGARKRG